MLAYRTLAENVQKKIGLSFDETLVTIAIALKAIAYQLSRHEALIVKTNIALELRQLVDKSQDIHGEASQIVEMISTSLEIVPAEAKRRALIFLNELKEGAFNEQGGPPSERTAVRNAEFLEIIDRLINEMNRVLAPPAFEVA